MAIQNPVPIDDMTYGRSDFGKKTLVNNLTGDIDKAYKKMTGADRDTVLKTINKYWFGSDSVAFIDKFIKDTDAIAKQMLKYKSVIESAIIQDSYNFSKMQGNNVNLIK